MIKGRHRFNDPEYMIPEIKQPRKLRAPRVRQLDIWETNDRRLLYMPDMEDAHLESALRLMLGMRMDERKYAKTLKHPYEIDQELEYRIRQLISELYRRHPVKKFWDEPKGFWAKLFGWS